MFDCHLKWRSKNCLPRKQANLRIFPHPPLNKRRISLNCDAVQLARAPLTSAKSQTTRRRNPECGYGPNRTRKTSCGWWIFLRAAPLLFIHRLWRLLGCAHKCKRGATPRAAPKRDAREWNLSGREGTIEISAQKEEARVYSLIKYPATPHLFINVSSVLVKTPWPSVTHS